MGCGSSAAIDSSADVKKSNSHKRNNKAPDPDTISTRMTSTTNNNECDKALSLEEFEAETLGSRITCRDSGIDSAKTCDGRRRTQNNVENENGSMMENHQAAEVQTRTNTKAITFDVMLDKSTPNQDSIIKRHPPKRLLQKLDTSTPKLTAEMLAERQQVIEERRMKIIEGRAKSAKRTSRRRQDILAAKDYSEKEIVDGNMRKMNDKLSSADTNRAHVHAEIRAKQKQREIKANQARERARKLNEEGTDDLNYEVEKDEMFNNDDADSWLDGSNNTEVSKGSSERIYDGRSSPVKKFRPLTSAERRRRQHSAGTDSEDNFTEKNVEWAIHSNGNTDEFFDC